MVLLICWRSAAAARSQPPCVRRCNTSSPPPQDLLCRLSPLRAAATLRESARELLPVAEQEGETEASDSARELWQPHRKASVCVFGLECAWSVARFFGSSSSSSVPLQVTCSLALFFDIDIDTCCCCCCCGAVLCFAASDCDLVAVAAAAKPAELAKEPTAATTTTIARLASFAQGRCHCRCCLLCCSAARLRRSIAIFVCVERLVDQIKPTRANQLSSHAHTRTHARTHALVRANVHI